MEDALRLAQESDLDLVEVAPDARPPVCKLMDYGKYKYEADMKAREARRNQANTVLKEIRFRLKIDPHDYGTKKGHVERFLKAGDKVKVMIMFRGREQSRPEMGVRLLQRLADDVAELGTIESMPRQDGRNMIMVLGPTKRKVDVKNEQRRRKEAEASKPSSEPATDAVEAAGARGDRGSGRRGPVVAPAPVVESKPAASRPAPAPVVEPEPAAAPEAAPVVEPEPAAPKAAPVVETKPAAEQACGGAQACCHAQARRHAQARGRPQACGAGRQAHAPAARPEELTPTRAARRVA